MIKIGTNFLFCLSSRRRAMPHFKDQVSIPACQWLQSTVEVRLELVKWGSNLAT